MSSIETDRIMYVTSLYSGNNTWHYVSNPVFQCTFKNFKTPENFEYTPLPKAPIPELTTNSFHTFGTFFKGSLTKFFNGYPTVDDNGVNPDGATPAQTQLARVASRVAEDMDSKGYCYSGVKHSLWTSGLINDYGDMPKGNASIASSYFENHPDIYKEVEVASDKIKDLPAGSIVVFSKKGEVGHIGISNGKGQLYSDCTDDGSWYDYKGGCRKGASYRVFQLTDNVSLNSDTGKLEVKKE